MPKYIAKIAVIYEMPMQARKKSLVEQEARQRFQNLSEGEVESIFKEINVKARRDRGQS